MYLVVTLRAVVRHYAHFVIKLYWICLRQSKLCCREFILLIYKPISTLIKIISIGIVFRQKVVRYKVFCKWIFKTKQMKKQPFHLSVSSYKKFYFLHSFSRLVNRIFNQNFHYFIIINAFFEEFRNLSLKNNLPDRWVDDNYLKLGSVLHDSHLLNTYSN